MVRIQMSLRSPHTKSLTPTHSHPHFYISIVITLTLLWVFLTQASTCHSPGDSPKQSRYMKSMSIAPLLPMSRSGVQFSGRIGRAGGDHSSLLAPLCPWNLQAEALPWHLGCLHSCLHSFLPEQTQEARRLGWWHLCQPGCSSAHPGTCPSQLKSYLRCFTF